MTLGGAVVAVVVIVIAVGTAARQQDEHTVGTDAMVTGTLRLAGGAPRSVLPDRGAVAGDILVYRTATYTGSPSAIVRTDGNGRYRLDLAPGTYYLAAKTPNYVISPRPPKPLCPSGPVVATRARTTQLDVICPMK